MALEKLSAAAESDLTFGTAAAPAASPAVGSRATQESLRALTHAGATSVQFLALLGRLPVVPAASLPMLYASIAPGSVEPPTLMPASALDAASESPTPRGSNPEEPSRTPILFGAWGLPGMCVPTLQPPAPRAARSASAARRKRSRSKLAR